MVPCLLNGMVKACRAGSNAEGTQVLSLSSFQGHPDAILEVLKWDPASGVCIVQIH